MIFDPTLDALIADQRQVIAKFGGGPPKPGSVPALPAEDLVLPSPHRICVRIIRPATPARGVLLHIHGGGFTGGSASAGDESNSEYVRSLGIATISVDYRLAPQHRHPAALDDCETAALWLLAAGSEQFGTDRFLIGGDSVGASLAVLTLLRLRDRHPGANKFCGANLTVGCYDFSMTPSQRQSTDELFLSPARLRATSAAAFPDLSPEALRDPQISALYAQLKGLPPAIFSIGTHDAVLDDSLFMAARWQAAGNVAKLEVYPEGPHLFFRLPSAMATEARRRIVQFLSGCIRGDFSMSRSGDMSEKP